MKLAQNAGSELLKKGTAGTGDPGFGQSGALMPFRFLYFIYYVSCRRDKMHMPNAEKPAITASYGLTFMIGWPIAAVLALLDHFTGWARGWTHWWLAMHLPDAGHKTQAYAFMTVVAVVDIILYGVIFNKNRYAWIMHEFIAYDPTQRTIAPALFFLFPFVPVAALCVYAFGDPIRGNLIIWSILIATEVLFRFWWSWWRQSHPA